MTRQTNPYQQVIPLAHIQGGEFNLGDRVVSLGTGIPAFGLHGTVIGESREGSGVKHTIDWVDGPSYLLPTPCSGLYDDAVEVLFDVVFPGGIDLGGRIRGTSGAFVPRDLVLNISTRGGEAPHPTCVGSVRAASSAT